MKNNLLKFHAAVIPGSGRGKDLGSPTMNLRLEDVPDTLSEGIYACLAELPGDQSIHHGALHYGPRPVFHDSPSCEVHLLDHTPPATPSSVTVTIVERLRDVEDFPSVEALQKQIAEDIAACRAILQSYAQSP